MKWFPNVDNINDLRNSYKKLLIKYHPDNNPNSDTTAIMQEINLEYNTLLNQFQSSNYTQEQKNEIKEILNELITVDANISIELIGSWIWVSGDTYPIKDRLKNLNFKWSANKKMWYWGELAHSSHAPMDISSIRLKYGSIQYKTKNEEPMKIQ